jgi:type II secretory ATPase GspE/PulE/Tfp pilus assembly ATPase PilB-like protein
MTLLESPRLDYPDQEAIPAVAVTRSPIDAVVAELNSLGAGADWNGKALLQLAEVGVSDVHFVIDSVSSHLHIYAKFERTRHDIITIEDPVASRRVFNSLKTNAGLGSQHASHEPKDGRLELRTSETDTTQSPLAFARATRFKLVAAGEKVVLRLPQLGAIRTLDQFGITETNEQAIRRLLERARGLIFAAGPTNEGKSTLLRAITEFLADRFGTIYTVEDPVEQLLPRAEQMEVNTTNDTRAGFADILASIKRADPDLVIIGEVRDRETARLAAQLADMGKLVLTSIHGADGVSALRQFVQLAETSPLSVLDGVAGVISQRLVRRSNGLGGYSGLHAIHEVLEKSNELVDAMIEGRSSVLLHSIAEAQSTSFRDNLAELIQRQVTDSAEARRVLGGGAGL